MLKLKRFWWSNKAKPKKALLISQNNDATMIFAFGCLAVATIIAVSMLLVK
jgi:hypothetical protein